MKSAGFSENSRSTCVNPSMAQRAEDSHPQRPGLRFSLNRELSSARTMRTLQWSTFTMRAKPESCAGTSRGLALTRIKTNAASPSGGNSHSKSDLPTPPLPFNI